MKASYPIVLSIVLAAVLLSGCGGSGGQANKAPDLCSPAYIKGSAKQVHDLTQQFDDEWALAQTVPISQVAPHIAALQAIRRAAQDQGVPSCLSKLKALQLTQMNTVIATMLGFLANTDAGSLNQGYQLARQQHDQYTLELARLLDVTPTIVTPPPTEAATETPAVTETPTSAAAQGTPAPPPAIVAVNPGPYPINLFAVPSQSGRLITTLDVGTGAPAIAQTTDGLWVQVQVPGHPDQRAWAMAAQVVLVPPTPVPTP